MKRMLATVLGAAAVFSLAAGADAYTPKLKSTISVTASGVTESTTFSTAIVAQGTADTAATLSFGTGGNAFRDSGEAIKVNVSTNLAANRVIVYTDNLNATASPQASLNTALGNDGGGLVGVTDRGQIVPMLWVIKDTNLDHVFTTATVGDDEIYITDRAHVATYVVPVGSTLDNQAMKRCADSVSVPNTPSDGLYPQFFGGPSVNQDLCDQTSGDAIPQAQELSKNIAVVTFNCLGTACTAPDLSTASPLDTIAVTSPIYLPLGANFSTAPAQDYATSTLTVELVTQ